MNKILKGYSIMLIAFFCLVDSAAGQYISHGPVFGGLTDHSARVYIRTTEAAKLEVHLNSDTENHVFEGNTYSSIDHSTLIDLIDLSANLMYNVRVYVGDELDTIKASFRTFPKTNSKGTYTFVTGSCQETENMKVFDVIPKHDPYFLLHTGDYTYPDYQIAPDYSANYETVAYSYHRRYDEKIMKEMLYTVPIDYVYDDNDYVGSSGGKYEKNYGHWERTGPFNIHYEMPHDSFPSSWRANVIRGYSEFFPHYPLVDTSVGIHHSFVFGNAEFFFLDRSSNRLTPQSYAFEYNEKRDHWKFNPPDDHHMFGKEQMDWLKEGLKNSTADWKFIVSGVPLNKSLEKLIQTGIELQDMAMKGYAGFHMASGFGSYWPAYPNEMNDFYEFMSEEQIKDVIVISGDTHHNVMDDGRNAGLPEMNASGLSVSGTELAFYVKLLGMLTGNYRMKKNIWNQGGNGIGNKNFKNAFGKVTILEDEYVELSIIDEDDEVISSFKVYHSTHPKFKKLKYLRK